MRISVRFEFDQPVTLSKSYQSIIQAFIYRLIKDEKYSTFLHNEGYGNDRKFKGFVFSNIIGPNTYNQDTKTLTFNKFFYLEIASPIDQFIENLLDALSATSDYQLLGQQIRVKELKIIPKRIHRNEVLVEMLSPIVVYKTEYLEDKKKTKYYNPLDSEFKELIQSNLENKLSAFNLPNHNYKIDIVPVQVSSSDKRVIRYKNHVIIGWMGTYRIIGSPKVLNLIHDLGIGGKNSQGFGMIKVK